MVGEVVELLVVILFVGLMLVYFGPIDLGWGLSMVVGLVLVEEGDLLGWYIVVVGVAVVGGSGEGHLVELLLK